MKRANFPNQKKCRQEATAKRQEERAGRTTEQQLRRLDDGEHKATKERARLTKKS